MLYLVEMREAKPLQSHLDVNNYSTDKFYIECAPIEMEFSNFSMKYY